MTLTDKKRSFLQHWLFGSNWASLINGFPNDIHNPAQGLRAHRDPDGSSSVQNLLAANQTLCAIHGNRPDCVLTWGKTWGRHNKDIQTNTDLMWNVFAQYQFGTLTQMLGHLENQPAVTASHLQRIEDRRQAFVELDVHHSTDHSHNSTVGQASLGSWGSITPAWKDNGRKEALMVTCYLLSSTS